MTLKQLEYFVEIVRSGSMAAASKKLYVSQSALSQACSTLEEEFRCSLFVKNGRGLVLTEKGRYLFEKGKDLLQMAETLSSDMVSRRDDQIHLPFYTDVVDNSDETMLIFSHFFPNVMPKRMHFPEQEVVERLKQDALAFLLTLRPISAPGVRSECLIDEPAVVLVRPEFRLAKRKQIWLRELEGETFLAFQNSESLVRLFSDFCSTAGIRAQRILSVHAPYLQVRQGTGIFFMPISTYNCLKKDGFLQELVGIPVQDSFFRRRVFLNWVPSKEEDSCRQGVFEFLRLYHNMASQRCCLPKVEDFEIAGEYRMKQRKEI